MTRIVDPVLEELRQSVLRMGSLAEAILAKALRAVWERDAALAAEVHHDDLEIDRIDVALDEEVTRALAPHTLNLHLKDFTVRRVSHMMGFVVEGTPAGQGMLDVPWLLRHMLEAKSRTVESVDCPQRVVADGQVVSCTVTTDDGTLIVTLQRQGGNYRVVESARVPTE